MKKKLTFLISLILILSISVCAFITPASSFQNDEITSSGSMLLINLDTKTIVFSQKANSRWFASYQSELMTFLLMTEEVQHPRDVLITVDQKFIDQLDASDGCLDDYIGEELTLADLAAIMLLTSGSDAAYLIADYVSGGDIDAFVAMMNVRAKQIDCTLTSFASPGYSSAKNHYTTCADLCRIYSRLFNNDLYNEIMSSPTYIPAKYGDDESYAVTTENSIMNPRSPYYFRYTTGGKFSDDRTSGAAIIVTTQYHDMTYLFAALRGKNEAEENVFTDARRLTTWAYLNLSDRKVIDTDTTVDTAAVSAGFGEYDVNLYADNSARKTLPNEYEQSKFTVQLDVPESLQLPLFKGESVGEGTIYYDGDTLDKVTIVPGNDEGVSLTNDLGRFGGYALAKLFPVIPGESAVNDTPEPATEKASKAPKQQKSTSPATEKTTEPEG